MRYMHCSPHMHPIYWVHDCMMFSFILSPWFHSHCMEPVKLYEVSESLSGHLSFPDSYFYWWVVVPWPSFELLMFDNFTLKEIRTDLFQPRLANTFTVTPILTSHFHQLCYCLDFGLLLHLLQRVNHGYKLLDHNDNNALFELSLELIFTYIGLEKAFWSLPLPKVKSYHTYH